MTTNSPNPVDGDVQALIEYCKEEVRLKTEHIERLEKHMPGQFDLTRYQMELQTAEIALAALTAEPVAWRWRPREFAPWNFHDEKYPTSDSINERLYTTPPAQILRPVELPFKRDLRDERENGFLERAIGWNECIDEVQRLNATAQPVNDGWVKCSERMPEDAQWCLVYTDYGQFAQCWSKNTNRGWLGDEISIPNIDVTHWMPLPAAPGGQDE